MCRITLQCLPHSKSLTRPQSPFNVASTVQYVAKRLWSHDTTFLFGGGRGVTWANRLPQQRERR